jgi:hypothetical protein
MDPLLLADDIGFWDVIWFMIIIFFWTLVLWMFIGVFADIFRRTDLSGWAKAGWIFLIVILPLLGILFYMIFRPAVTPSDVQMMEQAKRSAGVTSSDEIAKAHQLLQSGAITQAEFDQIKAKALG